MSAPRPTSSVPEAGVMSFTPSVAQAIFKMRSMMAMVKSNETGRDLSEDDLQRILKAAVMTSYQWPDYQTRDSFTDSMPAQFSSPPVRTGTPSAFSPGPALDGDIRRRKILNFGKYKGYSYERAYRDSSYDMSPGCWESKQRTLTRPSVTWADTLKTGALLSSQAQSLWLPRPSTSQSVMRKTMIQALQKMISSPFWTLVAIRLAMEINGFFVMPRQSAQKSQTSTWKRRPAPSRVLADLSRWLAFAI